MSAQPLALRVGVLGAGMIATMPGGVIPGIAALGGRVELVAIASRSEERAAAVAGTWGIDAAFGSLEAMLDQVEIDAVVNLTPIPAHFATSRVVLQAGKHLVSEKPLAATVDEANELLALAAHAGVSIVASPPRLRDPARVLARDLIRSGAIGTVAFARIRSSHAGPAARAWPADPAWFYAAGAGPLADMGVYGIQDATGLLGPATSVFAASSRITETRRVAGGPFSGRVIRVDDDDNVGITLEFEGGAFAFIDCTFNVRASRAPAIEIFGLEGTIVVRDDDTEPAVEMYRVDPDGVGGGWTSAVDDEFREARSRYRSMGRAVLLDDLVRSLDRATPPVLSAEHARHVIEIMSGARESARSRSAVPLRTRL